MIPTGFVILMTVPIFFLGYAVGGLVEFRKSQWEIDVLTKVIEGRCKEDESFDSKSSGTE